MRHPNLLHACLLLGSAASLNAATFTVDTTSNVSLTACTAAPADCSLPGAVTVTNGAAGTDTIAFNIPTSDAGCVAATGVCTIAPTTSLVVFGGGALIVDGTTQPGWQANTNTPAQGGINAQLKIELSGSNCPACTGLHFAAPGSIARGLVVHSFSNNVVIEAAAGGSVVEGCFIGTNVGGTGAPLPGDFGITLLGNPSSGEAASGVRIGGTLPAERNLISGHNAEGLRLTGYGIRVLGNLIGTDASGTVALGDRSGVFAEGGGNAFQYLIGDGTPAGRNVISGNRSHGVEFNTFRSIPTRDTRVQGNYIGTDVSGELPLGNGLAGVSQPLEVPSGDLINFSSQIGGLLPGQGNRIEFNGGAGILVVRPRNAVFGNRLSGNGGLGIAVLGTARHANDVNDADVGDFFMPLQNFPEISAFALVAGTVDMNYRVDSTTSSSAYPLRVEFFRADGDEGRDFLGFNEYTAGQAQTVKAISLPIPDGVTLTGNDVIVATATDAAGNSSEFSFSPATLVIATPVASP